MKEKSSRQPRNEIVVYKSHNAEDKIEGGYDYKYIVKSCRVDKKSGTLTYDRANFPNTPHSLGYAPHPKPRSYTKHVSELSIIGDEEILELRERGVEVTILKESFPGKEANGFDY